MSELKIFRFSRKPTTIVPAEISNPHRIAPGPVARPATDAANSTSPIPTAAIPIGPPRSIGSIGLPYLDSPAGDAWQPGSTWPAISRGKHSIARMRPCSRIAPRSKVVANCAPYGSYGSTRRPITPGTTPTPSPTTNARAATRPDLGRPRDHQDPVAAGTIPAIVNRIIVSM